MPVLDKGFLALDAALASDLAVVNGARVSFNQESDEMTDRDAGLIRFLVRERHGSPFEHGYFRFLVKAPLFVVREHHRHRAGHSYNEWSGRYSKMERRVLRPRERAHPGRQAGSLQLRARRRPRRATRRGARSRRARQRAFEAYERMLEQGVAKEVARAVLPLSTYTKYYWSCNPRSLMHFCGLRNHESAQYEIQSVRGRGGVVPRAADADHARRVRRERPHRALATTPS